MECINTTLQKLAEKQRLNIQHRSSQSSSDGEGVWVPKQSFPKNVKNISGREQAGEMLFSEMLPA